MLRFRHWASSKQSCQDLTRRPKFGSTICWYAISGGACYSCGGAPAECSMLALQNWAGAQASVALVARARIFLPAAIDKFKQSQPFTPKILTLHATLLPPSKPQLTSTFLPVWRRRASVSFVFTLLRTAEAKGRERKKHGVGRCSGNPAPQPRARWRRFLPSCAAALANAPSRADRGPEAGRGQGRIRKGGQYAIRRHVYPARAAEGSASADYRQDEQGVPAHGVGGSEEEYQRSHQ